MSSSVFPHDLQTGLEAPDVALLADVVEMIDSIWVLGMTRVFNPWRIRRLAASLMATARRLEAITARARANTDRLQRYPNDPQATAERETIAVDLLEMAEDPVAEAELWGIIRSLQHIAGARLFHEGFKTATLTLLEKVRDYTVALRDFQREARAAARRVYDATAHETAVSDDARRALARGLAEARDGLLSTSESFAQYLDDSP